MNYEKMWKELKSALDDSIHDVPPNIHPTVKKSAIRVFKNVIDKMNSIEKENS